MSIHLTSTGFKLDIILDLKKPFFFPYLSNCFHLPCVDSGDRCTYSCLCDDILALRDGHHLDLGC